MQINSVSNIKKMNSNNRQGMLNILGEYDRTNKEFKNNVNLNLSKLNVVLEENNLDDVLGNVVVPKSAKDVILLTCGVEMSEYERATETPGEYLLSLDEWKEYFKIKMNEYKKFMGEDFKIIKAVIHFDEMRPHLQVMGAYRSNNTNDIDMVKIERNMSMQFSRLNKKGELWETIEPRKDKKKYREKYQEWYDENIEKYKAKEIVKNSKNNIEYAYKPSSNKFNQMTSFKDFFDYNYNNDSKNELINKLLNKMRDVVDKVDFVRRKTVSRSASAKNIEDMKATIEYEKEYLKKKIDDNTATKEEISKYDEMKLFEKMIDKKLNYSLDEYLDNRKNAFHWQKYDYDSKAIENKYENESKKIENIGVEIENKNKEIDKEIEKMEEKNQTINNYTDYEIRNVLKNTLDDIKSKIEKNVNNENDINVKLNEIEKEIKVNIEKYHNMNKIKVDVEKPYNIINMIDKSAYIEKLEKALNFYQNINDIVIKTFNKKNEQLKIQIDKINELEEYRKNNVSISENINKLENLKVDTAEYKKKIVKEIEISKPKLIRTYENDLDLKRYLETFKNKVKKEKEEYLKKIEDEKNEKEKEYKDKLEKLKNDINQYNSTLGDLWREYNELLWEFENDLKDGKKEILDKLNEEINDLKTEKNDLENDIEKCNSKLEKLIEIKVDELEDREEYKDFVWIKKEDNEDEDDENEEDLKNITDLEKYINEEIPNAIKTSNDNIVKSQKNKNKYYNAIKRENKNIDDEQTNIKTLEKNMKKAKEMLENRKKVIEKHRNKKGKTLGM